jgi:hypothetical protein
MFDAEFESLPSNIQNEIICEKIKNFELYFSQIPERYFTIDLCLCLIRFDARTTLIYMPAYLKTYSLCFEAVKLNPLALEYVPDHLKIEDLCLSAIKRDRRCLKFIPPHMRTEKFPHL